MSRSLRLRRSRFLGVATIAIGTLALAAPSFAADTHHPRPPKPPGSHGNPMAGYKNLVVIFQENHSFDNLYGLWGRVNGEKVDGVKGIPQIAQDGTRFKCLLQVETNLRSPSPLPSTCSDPAHGIAESAFRNSPFILEKYVPADAATCPDGVAIGTGQPGGCTEDLVHRFYQNQYQMNNGRMNRFVTGSDAAGLAMAVHDTKQLPIYKYLNSPGAPKYVIADRFFQAAFGGSFLNHQYLAAARAPLADKSYFPNKVPTNAILDANGMPRSGPLYTPTGTVKDGHLTQVCPDGNTANLAKACGDFAVNTIQPAYWPYFTGSTQLSPQDSAKYPTIGDRLTDANVSWAWYSGGWNAANSSTTVDDFFQTHHQPYNYFTNYAPGKPGRAHLKDETEFIQAAQTGSLPAVSFVKPFGTDNQHPGYASVHAGDQHLVDLIKTIQSGPQAKDTLIVVTYDEFGGYYDHVAPPKRDAFGPGPRVPALILSAKMKRSGVDHTVYDTTSILATIEGAYRLAPVDSSDARARDLRNAVRIGRGSDDH